MCCFGLNMGLKRRFFGFRKTSPPSPLLKEKGGTFNISNQYIFHIIIKALFINKAKSIYNKTLREQEDIYSTIRSFA